MIVRQARLEDTHAISQLYRSRIERWQRLDVEGRVQDTTYEQLSLYEQWGHGGQWMNDYTATLWLSHLLRGAARCWVIEQDAQVIAYTEVFPNDEAVPYGRYWHISQIISRTDTDLRDSLMQHMIQEAVDAGRVTANVSAYDEEALAFFARYGLTRIDTVQRYELKTQIGQGFYRTTEHPDAHREQIRGWTMLTGRLSSAAQQWETLWTGLWDAIPEIAAEPVQRIKLVASGQEALVCCKQDVFNPRLAEVTCWSNKPTSAALLVAIRDWAHRAGYRSLVLWGDSELAKSIGSDGESSGQQRVIVGRSL